MTGGGLWSWLSADMTTAFDVSMPPCIKFETNDRDQRLAMLPCISFVRSAADGSPWKQSMPKSRIVLRHRTRTDGYGISTGAGQQLTTHDTAA